MRSSVAPAELARALTAGDHPALARALTVIERGGDDALQLVHGIASPAADTRIVGITGPPGAGKSTLTGGMLKALRRRGESVAVLAVDPSSPLTGGALLGDRLRITTGTPDDGLFVRSVASKGEDGGLAPSVPNAICLLVGAGFDWIVLETVGVGQVATDVTTLVDSLVLVLTPSTGDDVQAEKSGVLELADILVVNKSDQPGSDVFRRQLRVALRARPQRSWSPTLVSTIATSGAGVDDVIAAIDAHSDWLRATDLDSRRSDQRRATVDRTLSSAFAARLHQLLESAAGRRIGDAVAAGELTLDAALTALATELSA